MNSVEKFESLKRRLDTAKTEKVRAEAQLETLEKRQEELNKKVLDLTGASNLEEARTKLKQLKEKIDENLEKLEALFNETDTK